jgi:hypothetical protein
MDVQPEPPFTVTPGSVPFGAQVRPAEQEPLAHSESALQVAPSARPQVPLTHTPDRQTVAELESEQPELPLASPHWRSAMSHTPLWHIEPAPHASPDAPPHWPFAPHTPARHCPPEVQAPPLAATASQPCVTLLQNVPVGQSLVAAQVAVQTPWASQMPLRQSDGTTQAPEVGTPHFPSASQWAEAHWALAVHA